MTEQKPIQWRQSQDGRWQYLAEDGYWYEGTGPTTTSPRQPRHAAPGSHIELVSETSPDTMPAGAWLAITGGVLIAIATFLPWMSFTGIIQLDRNAFQLGVNESTTADGPVILIFAILTVLIGITRLTRSSMPRFVQRSTIVTGLVALVWTISDYSTLHSFVQQHTTSSILGAVGFGFWLCVVGGVLAVVSGLVLRQKQTQKTHFVPSASDAGVSKSSSMPPYDDSDPSAVRARAEEAARHGAYGGSSDADQP